MNIDPRDLFISLNPPGLDEQDLKKDSTGFADNRTHGDYLVFLAGYKAGAVDGEKRECQRHRPINAEGCKPKISTLLSGMSCTGAAPGRDLDNAEGCRPDLNISALLAGERGSYSVAGEVLKERIRQITVEGYTTEGDDRYTTGQLADAASAFAVWAYTWNMPPKCTHIPAGWPWAPETWKPTSQRQMLIKAGTLILAELERLDRMEISE